MSSPQTPPVKSSEEYFNSSRLKVIGLITAATVAVGALGGIAGVAFDPEPVEPDIVGPISEGDAAGGQSALLLHALPWLADEAQGSYVALTTGVEVWVPDGWRTAGNEEGHIFMGDAAGAFAFVAGGEINDSPAAADLIQSTLSGLLPEANYTQLTVSDIQPWSDAFGTVTSSAFVEYQALYVDDQGSIPVYGQIYSGTREDGLELVFLIEHSPPEGFNAAYDNVPLVTNTFVRFAGLG